MKRMKTFLSEKNLVVALFIMVFFTFSLAQEDSRKMEKAYIGINPASSPKFVSLHSTGIKTPAAKTKVQPADQPE